MILDRNWSFTWKSSSIEFDEKAIDEEENQAAKAWKEATSWVLFICCCRIVPFPSIRYKSFLIKSLAKAGLESSVDMLLKILNSKRKFKDYLFNPESFLERGFMSSWISTWNQRFVVLFFRIWITFLGTSI